MVIKLLPKASGITELGVPFATAIPLTFTLALASLRVGVIVIEETLLATV